MNMKKTPNKPIWQIILLSCVVLLMTTFMAVQAVYAFFPNIPAESDYAGPVLDVDDLFGRLSSPTAGAPWGSSGNPYLINESRHLRNLYILQNSKDLKVINENTVFQVSDADGYPCFVGGESAEALMEIPSIGSEDFPFISTLRGPIPDEHTIGLPGGEISNTSVIGNIRVTAYPGQIDIGLFGNIGKLGTGDVKLGLIKDLLLANIQIKTDAIGDLTKTVHNNYFTSEASHETNHIGILAGHAEYCRIYNISVYYEEDGATKTAKVNAFDVNAASTARYTTAGGIVGYYHEILVSDSELPVNSDGIITGEGGGTVGFGLGIMYSQDIWAFMENKYFAGGQAPNAEYGIKATFDEQFYGTNNTNEQYFQIGVFTFAHSNETRAKDRISKLWVAAGSNNWSVSTTGTYSSQTVDLGIESKKYVCTQVTDSHLGTTTINTRTVDYVSAFPTNTETPNYRFMIVVESNGIEYALIKYGATAAAQKIDTSNFIIPVNELNYYTFRVLTNRSYSADYPPYTSQSGYYHTPGNLLVRNTTTNSLRTMQYLSYGYTYPDSGKRLEAERPLRIYDTVSFMATSVSSAFEGVYVQRNSNGTFKLQRQIGSNSTTNNFLGFTEAGGFVYASSLSSAVAIKIYAVRITANSSTPSESPVSRTYDKQIYTPTSSIATYDMSKTVLKYTGTAGSSTPSVRYTYEMRSIESLGWSDNNGEPITQVETAMKMADPTSYYYLNSVFWGVLQNINSPKEMPAPFDKITVPLASIGFTVQGHGIRGGADQYAKVFVIVATDPWQLVDQTITISYFPYTTSPSNPAAGAYPTSISYSGTRQLVGSFVLPPVPGATTTATQNIWVTDGAASYIAYTNMSTVLVAYELEVPVSRYPRTYYLEASKGSANFVYLSAERTASGDSNPEHDNDTFLGLLNGVDYVALGDSTIVTVDHEDYVKSQVVPYFGLKANPDNPDGKLPGIDALKILNAKYFAFNIFRYYDTPKEIHTLTVNVNVKDRGSTITDAQLYTIMEQMDFNFCEWSYLDMVEYRRIYSDVVNTYINNKLINWTNLEDLYS